MAARGRLSYSRHPGGTGASSASAGRRRRSLRTLFATDVIRVVLGLVKSAVVKCRAGIQRAILSSPASGGTRDRRRADEPLTRSSRCTRVSSKGRAFRAFATPDLRPRLRSTGIVSARPPPRARAGFSRCRSARGALVRALPKPFARRQNRARAQNVSPLLSVGSPSKVHAATGSWCRRKHAATHPLPRLSYGV